MAPVSTNCTSQKWIFKFPEVFEKTENTVKIVLVYATTMGFNKTLQRKNKTVFKAILLNVGVNENQLWQTRFFTIFLYIFFSVLSKITYKYQKFTYNSPISICKTYYFECFATKTDYYISKRNGNIKNVLKIINNIQYPTPIHSSLIFIDLYIGVCYIF